jgi:hypothetical protein
MSYSSPDSLGVSEETVGLSLPSPAAGAAVEPALPPVVPLTEPVSPTTVNRHSGPGESGSPPRVSPMEGHVLFQSAVQTRRLSGTGSSAYVKYNTPAAAGRSGLSVPHSDPTVDMRSPISRRYNALCVDKPGPVNPFPYLATLHYQQYCTSDVRPGSQSQQQSPVCYTTAPSTPASSSSAAPGARKGYCRGTQTTNTRVEVAIEVGDSGNDCAQSDISSCSDEDSHVSVYYSASNTPIRTHVVTAAPTPTPSYQCGTGGITLRTPSDPLYANADADAERSHHERDSLKDINRKIVDYASFSYSYRNSRFWQRRLTKHGQVLQTDIDSLPANPLHYYTPIYRKAVHFMPHTG